MGCFLNIVKNDAGMSGRNWQIFDLNIIAHFLAKRIFDKSANFEKYSLREIDDVKTEFLMLRLSLFWKVAIVSGPRCYKCNN